MITQNENERNDQKAIEKKPSPADMARFIQRSKASNGMVRGAFIGIQANGGRVFTNEKGETGYSFGVESINGLSAEELAKLEELRLLLEGNFGEVVTNEDEAAGALGLDRADVDETYKFLKDFSEDLLDGDTVELKAIDFEKIALERQKNGEGDGTSQFGSFGDAKYLGRFRSNSEGKLISIAMDAVPQTPNNAAYVLRNDESYIADVEAALASKKAIRETQSYRQITHNEKTGPEGVRRRMAKALTMPYVDFLDREHIDL
ncbi:MAG: hypothetical protein WA030_00140 [Candidatus Microsaccharimonas sp.]